MNQEQKYRKQLKKQKRERAEKERIQTRNKMSKKLDREKIQQRIAFIDKEEQAGRMTIGLRNEKTKLTMELKSISKKTPQTDYAFMKKTAINDTRLGKSSHNKHPEPESVSFSREELLQSHSVDTNIPPPPPPPPVENVVIQNPMALHSKPLKLASGNVSSSFVPSSVKRNNTSTLKEDTPRMSNPIASSLVPAVDEKPKDEEQYNVPGPKLRFKLVSYGSESSSDENTDEDKNENTDDNKEDAALAQFMQEISQL